MQGMTNKAVEGVRGKKTKKKKVTKMKEGLKWVRSKEKEIDLDRKRRHKQNTTKKRTISCRFHLLLYMDKL